MELPLFGGVDERVSRWAAEIRTPALDDLTYFLLASDLRIGFLAFLLLYLWLRPLGNGLGNENFILQSWLAIFMVMFVTFLARHMVPWQHRPRLALAQMPFPPVGELGNLMDFRSFPSDTSALAAGLTAILFLRSRRLGWLALVWTVAAVTFPRLYIGYHYLSDLLAGWMLGALVGWRVMRLPVGIGRVTAVLDGLTERHRTLIVMMFIFVAYQIGTMFPVLQMLGRWIKQSLG